jgi:hypothetical protein
MMSGFIGGEYGIATLRSALALRFAFAAPDAPPNDPGFAIAPLSAFSLSRMPLSICVSFGASTTTSGDMPSSWIDRPLGV